MEKENDILKRVAYGLSAVLFPLFTPTYLMIVFCALFSQYMLPLPARYWWFALGGTLLFTCILPFTVLIVMKMQGRISDLDVSNRRERLIPFLYSIMFFSLWCAYLDAVLKVPLFCAGTGDLRYHQPLVEDQRTSGLYGRRDGHDYRLLAVFWPERTHYSEPAVSIVVAADVRSHLPERAYPRTNRLRIPVGAGFYINAKYHPTICIND